MTRRIFATLIAAVLAGAAIAHGEPARPTVQNAIDGVFAAFQTHPIVGIGDAHNGLAQEGEFYADLIKDPRFAAEVGNVVYEFGNSAYQATLDRYLDGEDVPHAEMQRIWRETYGTPTLYFTQYMTFLAEVRAVNQTLQPNKRIRVWLGQPPVDWTRIQKLEDLLPFVSNRQEEIPVRVIRQEILAHGKKALVIYGSEHFFSLPSPPGSAEMLGIKDAIERTRPGAVYLILAYIGYPDPACALAFEAETNWRAPVLAAPVKGSSLERALARPGCPSAPRTVRPAGLPPLSPELQAMQDRFEALSAEIASGVAGDALLYLGPAHSLTQSPIDPDIVLDSVYFKEISRRYRIQMGQALIFPDWASDASRAAPPYPR